MDHTKIGYDGIHKYSIIALFTIFCTINISCKISGDIQVKESSKFLLISLPLDANSEALPIVDYKINKDTIKIFLIDAENSELVLIKATSLIRNEIRTPLEKSAIIGLSKNDKAEIIDKKLVVFSYRFQSELHYRLTDGKLLKVIDLQKLLPTPGRLFLNPYEIKHPNYHGSLIYQIGHNHPKIENKETQISYSKLLRRCLLDSVENKLILFGSAPTHARNGISYEDGLEFNSKGKANAVWISQQNTDSIEEYRGKKLVKKHRIAGQNWIKNKPFDLSRQEDKKYKWDYLSNRSTYLWLYADQNKNLLYRIMQISSTKEFYLLIYNYKKMKIISEQKLNYNRFDFRVFMSTHDGFIVREVTENNSKLKLRFFNSSASYH